MKYFYQILVGTFLSLSCMQVMASIIRTATITNSLDETVVLRSGGASGEMKFVSPGPPASIESLKAGTVRVIYSNQGSAHVSYIDGHNRGCTFIFSATSPSSNAFSCTVQSIGSTSCFCKDLHASKISPK